MFALSSRLPSNYPPFTLTSLSPWNASAKQAAVPVAPAATVPLNKPQPCLPCGLAQAGAVGHCKRRHLFPKPRTSVKALGKPRAKEITSNVPALPGAAPTSEHQMWFWSREDVEPTGSCGRGEVRPSVLQRCGDAVTPAEEQRQWPSWASWPWAERGPAQARQKKVLLKVRASEPVSFQLLNNPKMSPQCSEIKAGVVHDYLMCPLRSYSAAPPEFKWSLDSVGASMLHPL